MGVSRRRVSRFLNGGGGRALVIVVILGLGAGATALFTGHSSSPPAPLAIGHAPAAPTAHVQVAHSPDAYGYDAVAGWPSACALLTDQDLRAIFPAATGDIHRVGVDNEILVNDVSGLTAGEQLRVPNGTCSFEFRLPASEDHEDSKVTVVVNGVGEPSTLRQDAAEAKNVADGCTYRPGYDAYLCGWVEVGASVEYLAIADDTHTGKSIDRFQVGGKVTSFDVADPLGQQSKDRDKFEDTHVTSELIKAILAKLPTS